MKIKDTEKVVDIATKGIVIYLLCFGVAMAFFPIRPFWNDEWRLIYNIKFKSFSALWGPLDLLQECPRVYLTIIKRITSFFDYSYISIRLPALVIGSMSILFVFYLRKKIFPGKSVFSYLFILILISSQTFTDYLVQVKQYEMDIFLCLLVLWQLWQLLEISQNGVHERKAGYALLCLSFSLAPFLSYIYPIAVAPVIPVIIASTIIGAKNKTQPAGSNKTMYLLIFPIALCISSIFIFYLVDVKNLMADDRMYLSYIKMLGKIKGETHFAESFWKLFALVGSGCIYELIFGVIGIVSFFYGIYHLSKKKMLHVSRLDYFICYGVTLLIVTLVLIFTEKLMGCVARLAAFTVPSISIVIICFLTDLQKKYAYSRSANILAFILFIGLFGNIVSTCINTFTYPEYSNRIKTYWNTSVALKQARLNNIPILFTDGVKGDKIADTLTSPGKISANTITADQISGNDILCAEVVLKVNPEYKTWAPIPVYLIPDMKWAPDYVKQLPADVKSVYVCDGINFMKVDRL